MTTPRLPHDPAFQAALDALDGLPEKSFMGILRAPDGTYLGVAHPADFREALYLGRVDPEQIVLAADTIQNLRDYLAFHPDELDELAQSARATRQMLEQLGEIDPVAATMKDAA